MAPSIQPVPSRPAHADGCSQRGQQMSHARAASLGLLPRPQSTSFKMLRLKNGDGQKKSRPAGNACTELSVHGIKGDTRMRNSATARTQPNLVGQPTFVGIAEKEAAESFAAAVVHLDAYTLARAAGNRNIETARIWKAGKRCPNGASLINMGRTLIEVQNWINGEIDSRKPHIPVDPRAGNAAIALLQQEAHQRGERGAMARAMLAQLSMGQ